MGKPAPEWTLSRLLQEAGLTQALPDGAKRTTITSLADDSRCVTDGSCFVAVRGLHADGHAFIDRAIQAGAVCVISQEPVTVPPAVIGLRLSDTRSALARLAAVYFGTNRPPAGRAFGVIGVTGTNGKSTTVELIRSILVRAGQPTAMLGTVRNDLVGAVVESSMTTPPPLELHGYLASAIESGARWAAIEVSSHALDQRRCDGIDFAAGVFTNLTGDHLDYHGDMDHYLRSKKRLFDGLAEHATAIINADDAASGPLLKDCRAKVVRFGIESRADLCAKALELTATGARFELEYRGGQIAVATRLVGRHNVLNALAAAGTVLSLGMSLEQVADGLQQAHPVRGRLERVAAPGERFTILVDYAHTDDALRNVLESVRPLTAGRVICVFGCGGDRDRGKRSRMGAVAAALSDVAIITSDNPRTEDPDRIIADIRQGIPSNGTCCVEVERDRVRAIESAISRAGAGDTVLIAGKGHENYQIIGQTRSHFDDVEVARDCLSRMEALVGAVP